MIDPAVELVLETLLPRVREGDEQALDDLMRTVFMLTLLSRLAEWAERRKGVEADERGTSIQEIIAARIREKVHTLRNPNQAPLHRVLTSWSYRVASRCCEDVRKRRTRLFEEHRRVVEQECAQRTEQGGKVFEPVSPTPSPEEELQRKEEVPLREKIGLKIQRTAIKARAAASPTDKLILDHWVSGKTLQQISDAVGLPVANVHRRLKRIQRSIVSEVGKGISEEIGDARTEECGVFEVLEQVVADRQDLGGLLASSPEHPGGGAQPPSPPP